MTDIPPASKALTDLGVPHRVFRHPGPVHSLEQAAQERGQTPEQVIRSILFRLGEGNYVLVLVAGPAQISWPALRSFLGTNRISMASEAEVLSATQARIGSVGPFGLPEPVRTIADESVFVPDEVSIGSGERGVAIIIKREDLRRALPGVEIGKLTSL
jgi:prolyl-tRNA editing enzyme YbaK/EbsC (Cys-tRNA(Pro) deacylase)